MPPSRMENLSGAPTLSFLPILETKDSGSFPSTTGGSSDDATVRSIRYSSTTICTTTRAARREQHQSGAINRKVQQGQPREPHRQQQAVGPLIRTAEKRAGARVEYGLRLLAWCSRTTPAASVSRKYREVVGSWRAGAEQGRRGTIGRNGGNAMATAPQSRAEGSEGTGVPSQR